MKRSEELEERKRLSMKKSRRRNGERVGHEKKGNDNRNGTNVNGINRLFIYVYLNEILHI